MTTRPTKPTKPNPPKKKRKGKRFWSREKKRRLRRENEQILAVLQALHPDTFNRDKPIPLALGVHNSIKEALPDASKNAIQRFLIWWTNRRGYHGAVLDSAFRYKLDGTVDGPVTPCQLENSRRRLKATERADAIRARKASKKAKAKPKGKKR